MYANLSKSPILPASELVKEGASSFLDMLDDVFDAEPQADAREILPDWTVGQLYQRGVDAKTISRYADLIYRARAEFGYASAKDFLRDLLPEEIEVLEDVYDLQRPIRVENLTAAEARSLLNPFAVNRDAMPVHQFPPPQAPNRIHRAWNEAVAGMTDLELLEAMAPFLAQAATVNTVYDRDNFPVGGLTPADPDHVDIYGEPRFSFADQALFMLEALELHKVFLETPVYLHKKAMLEKYRRGMTRSRAA